MDTFDHTTDLKMGSVPFNLEWSSRLLAEMLLAILKCVLKGKGGKGKASFTAMAPTSHLPTTPW